MNKICIMGLGYIGLPTALIAARHECSVIGFDIDQQRVAAINAGDPVIKEPEIVDHLKVALKNGSFRAVTMLAEADYFIIAVPTPFKEGKKADLSYVWRATNDLVAWLRPGNVVIVESTIPVGLTDQIASFLQNKTGLQIGRDLFVAHCPERVLPGNIFHELVYNARIIGGVHEACVHEAKKFYKRFVKGQLYLTSALVAEMVKLVENSSRDVEIAFANQVASMAYCLGLNPFEVIELANKHPRVDILSPSCGVGGHCIAVDPWFLVESFPEHTKLLKSARLINDEKPMQVIAAVRNAVGRWHKKHGKIPVVLALGLTYKPNVDDMRESPAFLIAKKLQQLSDTMRLLVCDSYAPALHIYDQFGAAVVSLQQGVAQADIIVCLVKHTEFKVLESLKRTQQQVLDFCGLMHQPREEATEMIFWPAKAHYGLMLPGDTQQEQPL